MVKKYQSKDIHEVKAIQFLPITEHKLKLPNRVHFILNGHADNFAYEGIDFFFELENGQLIRIKEGDYIVYDNEKTFICEQTVFEKSFKEV